VEIPRETAAFDSPPARRKTGLSPGMVESLNGKAKNGCRKKHTDLADKKKRIGITLYAEIRLFRIPLGNK
jgi:hypothetical protein